MSAFMAVGGVCLALECSNGRTKVRFNFRKSGKWSTSRLDPPACRESLLKEVTLRERTILRTETVVRFLRNLWRRFLWPVSGRGQVRAWRGSSEQKGAKRWTSRWQWVYNHLKCDQIFILKKKQFHPTSRTSLFVHKISISTNKINQKMIKHNQNDSEARHEEPP